MHRERETNGARVSVYVYETAEHQRKRKKKSEEQRKKKRRTIQKETSKST